MILRDEHTELIALIESVLNNSASGSEVQRLDSLLDEDAAARTLYLDYVDLHAGLSRRFAHPLPEADESEAFSPSRTDGQHATPRSQAGHSMRNTWRALGLLAIAASLPLAFLALPLGQPAEDLAAVNQMSPDQQASLTGVAVLSRAVDVEWAGQQPAYRQGVAVPASKLAIDSGVLQLEFYSGAVAVLEGPAEIDLIDPMSARLHSGKLRARVPPRARGFTIHTEKGEVVDLGTEFALDLGSQREWGELHVIDGEVRYDPNQESGHASRQVFGGEAMHLGREAEGDETLQVAGDRFIGPAEIEKISRKRKTERRRQWRKWRSEILSDPSLVALYGHSPEPEWSRTLRNYAPNGGGDTHGVIVGGDWAPGRWQGQRALRFRNASHRVSVNLPGEHDSITLATWLKIDRFHPTNRVALMHPEIPQPHIIHWTLDRVPSGAMLHFAESSEIGRPEELRLHYSSVHQCIRNHDAGRWVHLATVYDSKLKRVSHYRDGEMLAWSPIEMVRPISIGMADIGNWPYKNWAKGTDFEVRNLLGRFDEFLVMGRAMTGKELAELYEVGKP